MNCKLCGDSRRAEIDAAVLSLPSREVARRFGCSKDVVLRHKDHCDRGARAAIDSGRLTKALLEAFDENWKRVRRLLRENASDTRSFRAGMELCKRIEDLQVRIEDFEKRKEHKTEPTIPPHEFRRIVAKLVAHDPELRLAVVPGIDPRTLWQALSPSLLAYPDLRREVAAKVAEYDAIRDPRPVAARAEAELVAPADTTAAADEPGAPGADAGRVLTFSTPAPRLSAAQHVSRLMVQRIPVPWKHLTAATLDGVLAILEERAMRGQFEADRVGAALELQRIRRERADEEAGGGA